MTQRFSNPNEQNTPQAEQTKQPLRLFFAKLKAIDPMVWILLLLLTMPIVTVTGDPDSVYPAVKIAYPTPIAGIIQLFHLQDNFELITIPFPFYSANPYGYLLIYQLFHDSFLIIYAVEFIATIVFFLLGVILKRPVLEKIAFWIAFCVLLLFLSSLCYWSYNLIFEAIIEGKPSHVSFLHFYNLIYLALTIVIFCFIPRILKHYKSKR